MELPGKELTFPIQVIGTTIHQVFQTRKQEGILIPELPGTNPVRSSCRGIYFFQALCACPRFSLFLLLLGLFVCQSPLMGLSASNVAPPVHTTPRLSAVQAVSELFTVA